MVDCVGHELIVIRANIASGPCINTFFLLLSVF